jgi:hypothetical protein
MRAWTISWAVLMFCWAINIVNVVDYEFSSAHGGARTLFGFQVTSPLGYDSIAEFNSQSAFMTTVQAYITPVEQMLGVPLLSLVSSLIFMWSAGISLIKMFLYSTLGFFIWIRNMGRSDMVIIPDYIAGPISAGVYAVYLMAVYQWWGNRNANQGG